MPNLDVNALVIEVGSLRHELNQLRDVVNRHYQARGEVDRNFTQDVLHLHGLITTQAQQIKRLEARIRTLEAQV